MRFEPRAEWWQDVQRERDEEDGPTGPSTPFVNDASRVAAPISTCGTSQEGTSRRLNQTRIRSSSAISSASRQASFAPSSPPRARGQHFVSVWCEDCECASAGADTLPNSGVHTRSAWSKRQPSPAAGQLELR
jgi:hypothetical protein